MVTPDSDSVSRADYERLEGQLIAARSLIGLLMFQVMTPLGLDSRKMLSEFQNSPSPLFDFNTLGGDIEQTMFQQDGFNSFLDEINNEITKWHKKMFQM